jgi:hypothetical protein
MTLRLPVLLIALIALTACSTWQKVDDPPESTVMVYGYLDMEDAPTVVDYVHLKQVKPKTDTPYWSTGVDEGYFFSTGLVPGSYQFSTFGGVDCLLGNFLCGTPHEYSFPAQTDGFRFPKPGLYFLGSYKYKHIDRGMFKADNFDIERIKAPTELDVLKKVRKHYENDRWLPLIDKRIKELSK